MLVTLQPLACSLKQFGRGYSAVRCGWEDAQARGAIPEWPHQTLPLHCLVRAGQKSTAIFLFLPYAQVEEYTAVLFLRDVEPYDDHQLFGPAKRKAWWQVGIGKCFPSLPMVRPGDDFILVVVITGCW